MNINAKNASLDAAFFEEYTSHDAILKYTRATAGHGISYLLDHEYKDVYLRALDAVPTSVRTGGIRILEFGCGGGMNLIHLLSMLRDHSQKVEHAVGTDFSPTLIEAAKREAKSYLPENMQQRIEFHVARNESLVADLANAAETSQSTFPTSFDFILGVNTIRYCHRFGNEMQCANDVMRLLSPGGVCVVIDMNDRFPAFRSSLKRKLSPTPILEECYLPSLQEYVKPFEKTGFDILRREHFCWIPHSAGPALCRFMRVLSPILTTLAPSRAMRSLVVARKPVHLTSGQ